MLDLKNPTRRTVLLSTSAALVAPLMTRALPAMAGEATGPRPNIIWLICHDIHAPLIGTYGNALAQTPTIDGLAKNGIRYDNAFSVAPVCSPSRFSLVTGMYPDSCGPANQMRGVGHVPTEFKPLPVLMREAGYYAINNVFTDYNCDLDPTKIWDECSITAHWRDRPEGKPFYAVFNYIYTHESQAIHYDVDKLVTDPADVTVPPYLPDVPDIRNTIARNTDMVNNQDKAVKKLLDELDADGLADNTIVIFAADHGGIVPRSKRYCYDEGLRVPLIVHVPEALADLRAGQENGPTDRVISGIDLAPTTLALAGVDVPDYMDGTPFLGKPAPARELAFSMRNRMDERYDIVRTVRDTRYRYIRNYSPHRIYGQHNAYPWQLVGYQVWEKGHLDGTLDKFQNRFWGTKPREELYDLQEDPHQRTNLAGDLDQTDRMAHFRKALDAHMLATNDNGLIPEGVAAEGYWPSRKPGAYPIADVMDLAERASDQDPANAGEFIGLLEHDNVVMRFWAAQGLVMMGPLSEEDRAAAAARMQTEKSDHVRSVLAEAVGQSGDAPAAVEVLIDVLDNSTAPRANLLALESLTYLPVKYVTPARDAIDRVGKANEYTLDAATYLKLKIDGTYTPSSKTFLLDGSLPAAWAKTGGNPDI